MLFAFISYKQQFVDKAARLIERAIEFRMLDLHLERLADIAGAEPEERHIRPAAYQAPIEGNLEVRGLCFRYAEGEPFVLAITRARAARRPGISSSGSMVITTRSCGSRPRRASSAATLSTVVSITSPFPISPAIGFAPYL
jgi:hypothetical protein